jgi:spore germination protein
MEGGRMEGTRITYVFAKDGETWDDLSARYGMEAEELRRLNEGVSVVASGSLIKVRVGEPSFRQKLKNTRYVLGFYTGPMGVNLPGSQQSFERHSDLLSAIAPYWFDLDLNAPGRIKPRVVPSTIRDLVNDAHRRGVKVLASIHNTDRALGVSRTEVLHSVLRAQRMNFFNNLFALLAEYGFDGINLDFERLRENDRDLYTDFVRDLGARAHQKGYTVVVDVLGDATKTPYSLDFDYPGLAQSVDYLAIMTYDQYRPSEPAPGPVASLPWMEETLRLALEEGVPPHKILLGIGVYGYDWTVGQVGARAMSFEAIERLRQQQNAYVTYHSTFQVPHLTYLDGKGERHEVWYENARSVAAKLDLVRKYDLGGIILWRLGLEDPAVWNVIRARLSPIE